MYGRVLARVVNPLAVKNLFVCWFVAYYHGKSCHRCAIFANKVAVAVVYVGEYLFFRWIAVGPLLGIAVFSHYVSTVVYNAHYGW